MSNIAKITLVALVGLFLVGVAQADSWEDDCYVASQSEIVDLNAGKVAKATIPVVKPAAKPVAKKAAPAPVAKKAAPTQDDNLFAVLANFKTDFCIDAKTYGQDNGPTDQVDVIASVRAVNGPVTVAATQSRNSVRNSGTDGSPTDSEYSTGVNNQVTLTVSL